MQHTQTGVRLPSRFNAAAVYHVRAELEQALKLCGAAIQAECRSAAEHSLAEARALYQRSARLIPRVQLNPAEAREITERQMKLRAALMHFGILVEPAPLNLLEMPYPEFVPSGVPSAPLKKVTEIELALPGESAPAGQRRKPRIAVHAVAS
jgi:hypothetical protein